MKNQISLNIKTPCSENFDQFTPTTKGGFCESCTKEVIDFTTMTAQQIINYFTKKDSQKTCGKFSSNQLTTYNLEPKQNKRLSLLSGIGLACLTLFTANTAQAQDTNTKENTTITQTNKEMTIKGTTRDQYGEPIPFVNIVLSGTSTGVASDEKGNFQFPKKLKKGDVLVFSFIGYASKKVVIKDTDSSANIQLNVDMNNEEVVIMGRVAVKEVFKSKRD